MLLIQNGWIHDAVHREPYAADILVQDGKLVARNMQKTRVNADELYDFFKLAFDGEYSHRLSGHGVPVTRDVCVEPFFQFIFIKRI